MMVSGAATRVPTVDGLWALPEGWKWVPLEVLCSDIVGGGTPKRARDEYYGGDIIWVTPSDLEANNPSQAIFSSRNKLTPLGLESSSAKLVPEGTILFSSRATIGKIAIAGVPLCTNQGFANLICGDLLDNHYLAWCLYALTDEVKKLAGSTTYLEVSRGNLRWFKIPLPFPNSLTRSLETQRRIAARIEALMAEVKRARTLLEYMRHDAGRLMDAILKQAFDKLASELELEPLAEHVIHLTSGPRHWGRYAAAQHSGPMFVRVGNVGFGRIDLDDVERLDLPLNAGEERAHIKSGDVLVTITETIGRCCVAPANLERAYVNQHVALIRLKPAIEPRYLMWFILSPSGGYVQATTMQYGQTRPGLNLTNVRDLRLPIPTRPVQQEIVSYLDSVQSAVDVMGQKLDQNAKLIDQLEQSILQQAFRGEL